MAVIFFRVLGGMTLYFLAGVLFIGLLPNGRDSFHFSQMSRNELLRVVLICIIILSVGLGLIFLRKWAALVFSVATLYWSYKSFRDGLGGIGHHSPGEWYWVGFVFSIALLFPAISTIKYWRSLSWRSATRLKSVA